MHSNSWKSALRAATKVAFATSLMGCGGVVVIDNADDGSDTDSETTPDVVPPDPPRTACVPPTAGWQTYDAPTFDCCVDAVLERVDQGPLEFDGQVTDEVAGCCTQIVTPNYDSIWSGGPLAYDAPAEAIAGCCTLMHGDPGCTPWGPPSPPAMDPGDASPWLALMQRALEGAVA